SSVTQQLLKSDPVNPRGLLSQGRILIAQGKYHDAVANLDKVTKADPSSPNAFYFLGVAQQSLGLTALAKTSYSRALELSPGVTKASLALVDIATRERANAEGSQLAREALKANPNSVPAYVADARAMLAQGDAPQADAMLEEALKKDPASLPALALL